MENNLNNELKDLILAFSDLDYKTQKEEIENKLKILIDVICNINHSQETQEISINETKEQYISTIFMLCCILEEEIAKTLEKIIN